MNEQNCNPCELPQEKFSLWGVTYHIGSNSSYKGMAVIQARDAAQANQILKAESAFNSTPNDIIIEATAQIPDVTESGLCIESYISVEGTLHINYGH